MIALVAALLLCPMTRQEFYARSRKLEQGISRAQVRQVLGPPDGILSEADPRVPIEETDIVEVWGYGGYRKGSFPAAGTVTFTANGRAWFREPFGNLPKLQTPEKDLSQILDLIGRDWSGPLDLDARDDPLQAIRLANRLLPFGKDRILDAFEALQWITNNSGRSFNLHWQVMALLFGMDTPCPMQTFEGIPLPSPVPWSCIRLPSDNQLPFRELRLHGVLRKDPVVPPDDPLRWLERLAKNREWKKDHMSSAYVQEGVDRSLIPVQRNLVSLLRTVVGIRDSYDDLAAPDKVLDELSGRRLRWDRRAERYAFDEGTIVAKSDRSEAVGTQWSPETLKGINGRILVTRRKASEEWITIRYDQIPKGATKVFFSIGSPRKVVGSVSIGSADGESTDDPVCDGSSRMDASNGVPWLSTRLFIKEGETVVISVQDATGRTEERSFDLWLRPAKF